MTKNTLTAGQLKKLPWPKALLSKQSLSVDDCYQIGQIIVEKVQQGEQLQRRARKAWSMRRLQQELGVGSAAAFTRSVQVFQVAHELGLKRPLQGVSASTLFLMAGLPQEGRTKIARRVIKERWSKRRIEAELGAELAGRRVGRPRGLTCINALARCASLPLTVNLDQAAGLEATQRKAAVHQLQRLTADIAALRKLLVRAAELASGVSP
ncbi:MAG TPA: hypothetical protein VL137_00525 [Polyangiaceae bacterium]|nr:hypothetical protein [Polyangiaceae bacterium]